MDGPEPGAPAPPPVLPRLRKLLAHRTFIICACAALGLAAVNGAVVAAIAAGSHPRATNWPAPEYVFWPLRSWRTVERRLDELPRSARLSRGVLDTVSYRGVSFPIHVLHFRAAGAGERPAKVLLVSGVHGTETSGVEALLSLAADLARDPAALPAAEIDIVPVANPWGWVYGYRYNGDGEDMNRDFASRRTREAAAIRGLVARNGPYDLVMDLHESKKYGYFLYQYLPRGSGLGEQYARILRDMGKPAQENYREGLFRTRGGVLRMPAVVLPWVAAARQLSLEHYTRLHGSPQSYTVETPLWDEYDDRVRVHRRAVSAFIGSVAAGRDAEPVLGR
jgi:hypothetical protein